MVSPVPAPTDGALKAAVAGAALLCVLIVLHAARLGLAGAWRLVPGKWAIGVLAVAVSFGAFEYQSHHAWRTAMNNPETRGQAAPASPREEEMTPAGGKTIESAEEKLRLERWKISLEEAVNNAVVKGQDRQNEGVIGGDGDATPKRTNFRPQEEASLPMDLAVVREVERKRAEASELESAAKETSETKEANEAKLTPETKETAPPSQSPVVATRETDSTDGPAVAGAPESTQGPPSRPTRRHLRERGHSRGGPYRWAYTRLVGVARAFPKVWYLTR
jgi:hypothetical protein